MVRLGAKESEMREMELQDIFFLRLKLLIVMAYAYLEGYPMGEFRKTSLIENALQVAKGVVDWGGRINNFRTYHESNGEIMLDHLFFQRVKLLTVMIRGVADGNPMGHYRDRALKENADYICEAISFNSNKVNMDFLKVA